MDLKKLSKTVAHALRHRPWLYELELDENEWVPVDQLLQALRPLRKEWRKLSVSDITRMIEASDKRRYEIVDDRIRALYGHSIPTRISKVPEEPPEFLCHGTSPGNLNSIIEKGLKPMNRQYVHLSVDTETAYEVGKRKSKSPVILTVMAKKAYEHGIAFYRGNDMVWLADAIPSNFIEKHQIIL